MGCNIQPFVPAAWPPTSTYRIIATHKRNSLPLSFSRDRDHFEQLDDRTILIGSLWCYKYPPSRTLLRYTCAFPSISHHFLWVSFRNGVKSSLTYLMATLVVKNLADAATPWNLVYLPISAGSLGVSMFMQIVMFPRVYKPSIYIPVLQVYGYQTLWLALILLQVTFLDCTAKPRPYTCGIQGRGLHKVPLIRRTILSFKMLLYRHHWTL